MLVAKYLCFLLPLLGSAFPLEDNVPMYKLQWLVGTWQQKHAKGVTYETWRQVDDSTFFSKSYYIKGSDTMMLETVSLEQRGGKLLYVATTVHQNNAQPVAFEFVAGTSTALVFENPQHDFPTRITYTYKAPDSLMAEISGMVNGKVVARPFPMSRISSR